MAHVRGKRKVERVLWLVSLLFVFAPMLSYGQEYPKAPMNMLVSFAPGGVVDISGRMLAGKAEKFLGKPFVISNNGGSAGAIATAVVSKQNPDGYHLLSCASTSLISVPLTRKVPYKLEDLTPIMHYGTPLSGVAVRADAPWKTLKELVEYARKNPGKIKYSTSGIGGPHHLSMEFIARQEGIKWTHIPYSGGTPGLVALLGGHVQVNVGSSWIFHSDQGSIRPLGIHSEMRSKMFPSVPTFRESGYDFINDTVFMYAAPKGTPQPYIARLEEAFHKGMDDPEFVHLMAKLGIEIIYRNSADTKKFLEAAYVSVGKMITDFDVPKKEKD